MKHNTESKNDRDINIENWTGLKVVYVGTAYPKLKGVYQVKRDLGSVIELIAYPGLLIKNSFQLKDSKIVPPRQKCYTVLAKKPIKSFFKPDGNIAYPAYTKRYVWLLSVCKEFTMTALAKANDMPLTSLANYKTNKGQRVIDDHLWCELNNAYQKLKAERENK